MQELEEPIGEDEQAHREFGGRRVLAVMRPPPQELLPHDIVSVCVCVRKANLSAMKVSLTSFHFIATRQSLHFVQMRWA